MALCLAQYFTSERNPSSVSLTYIRAPVRLNSLFRPPFRLPSCLHQICSWRDPRESRRCSLPHPPGRSPNQCTATAHRCARRKVPLSQGGLNLYHAPDPTSPYGSSPLREVSSTPPAYHHLRCASVRDTTLQVSARSFINVSNELLVWPFSR